MTTPTNTRFTPVFGLRLILVLVAIILYILFLTESAPNIHLLAWAGLITAVAVAVP